MFRRYNRGMNNPFYRGSYHGDIINNYYETPQSPSPSPSPFVDFLRKTIEDSGKGETNTKEVIIKDRSKYDDLRFY